MRLPKPFRRRLRKKTPQEQAAIARTIKKLREDARRSGLRVSKLGGTDSVFEVRIDKSRRLTFEWEGDTMVLLNHCDHDKVLNNPRAE